MDASQTPKNKRMEEMLPNSCYKTSIILPHCQMKTFKEYKYGIFGYRHENPHQNTSKCISATYTRF